MNIIGISGLDQTISFRQRELPNLSSRQHRITQGLDSAASLVCDGRIVAAVAEERFTREKATEAFPVHSIDYCLRVANLSPDDIDFVAHGFSYEPYKSFYEEDGHLSLKRFKEVYAKEVQIRCIEEKLPSYNWSQKLVPVPHHLAHAASTFYPSGFEESLILVVDGMGEVDSMTVAIGRENKIKIIKRVPALHSLGVLYGIFTLYLGFYMNLDEYKVMGLAPYGNPRRFHEKLMKFVSLKKDGTYSIPLLSQDKTMEEKETHAGALQVLTEIFGPSREPNSEISQNHMDIAAALQSTLQASLMHVVRHFKKETGLNNLCMSGGVALNCTANGAIKRSRLFKKLFIQPAAGDDGTSLGAALYVQHQKAPEIHFQKMTVPLWGPEYSAEEIKQVVESQQECEYSYYESFDSLVTEAARRFVNGQIASWFQGRMEFGPRALGSRSILADPRLPDMRDKINKLVKKREEFRPFAPAIAEEAVSKIFEVDEGDEWSHAHMLFVIQVRKEYQKQLPAITHVDGSARVQSVAKNDNPRFWAVLNEFGKLSGIPILLNTSFNVRGQPIVCTPKEACETFLFAGLDFLVIGNYLLTPKTLKE